MRPIVEIKDCTMSFSGLTAVRDISLSLESGHIYGLIGTNGAGKTTVINMLSGILKPTSGEIVYDGGNIAGMKPYQIAKKGILRTYQNLRLFNKMTVLDNVIIGTQIVKPYSMAMGIMQLSGFRDQEELLRHKAMKMLEEMDMTRYAMSIAGSLPYGLQRRLEIARILAANPRVLLLDEPAAGMNPQESRELVDMIRHVQKEFDLTVLIIEHDMKVIMNLCEYIFVMATGEIIAQGDPTSIRSDSKVIASYLGRAV